jgi:hypothetical protein
MVVTLTVYLSFGALEFWEEKSKSCMVRPLGEPVTMGHNPVPYENLASGTGGRYRGRRPIAGVPSVVF